MTKSLSYKQNGKKMHFLSVHKILLATMLGSVCLLAACAKKDDNINLSAYVETLDPPDVLYNQGLANLEQGRYGEASKKFAAIDRQHPYTEWARKALVMGAYTEYRQAKYADAVNTAQRYISLYPTSKEAAYAYYIVGLSYFNQIPDITRDQSNTVKAIDAMQELVDRFPKSEYVDDAKTKIRFSREQLAGKEMQIGRYYQERKQYLSAIKRYRVVVELYSNTNQIEEALYRLTEANYAMGLVDEAQTAAAVLGKNYPESSWYSNAYNLLQKGGVSPKENKSSWVSNVFSKKKKAN